MHADSICTLTVSTARCQVRDRKNDEKEYSWCIIETYQSYAYGVVRDLNYLLQ